ncbi:MAG: YfcE family phosphodiesterase [Anaerolineales bacterium]
MRVGLISDIHGNLPALEAVLDHARDQKLEAIWNLGDSVGYGAEPDQVVRLLRKEGITSIQGNFDSKALKIPRKKTKWREKKFPDIFLAMFWAYENLTAPSREYLSELPRDIVMRVGATRVLLTHGSPASRSEELTMETPASRLQELLDGAGVQVVCCGHSHESMFRKVGDGYFINPGSVGRSNDGDYRASYGVLEFAPEMLMEEPAGKIMLEMHQHRVQYDLEKTISEIRKRGLPESFAQMIIQGRDLTAVLKYPERWQVPELEKQGWWQNTFGDRSRQEVEQERIKAVTALAEEHSYPEQHVQQTTFLALRLFDELQPLHRLGRQERFWLQCGSLLHDIGKGKKNHHVKALNTILNSENLPFTAREKRIIGSIARYHRGENPQEKHDNLADLPIVDQRAVTILSSILRVADGLDASPRGNVKDLKCSFSAEEITIKCQVDAQAEKQKRRALGKGELLEFAFDRDLYIEWQRI